MFKRETATDEEDVDNDDGEVDVPAPTEQEEIEETEQPEAEAGRPVAQFKQAVSKMLQLKLEEPITLSR